VNVAGRPITIGIALGSGSARGWAHIGVLQALVGSGIVPRVVCGTSIGSLVGAVYADGGLDALERWVKALSWRKVVSYFDLSFSGGIIKGEKLFDHLRGDLLTKHIEELERPFAAVATDLANGREVWLRAGPVADAVRASLALPGLFTPWPREGRLLVDGALVNPVPVSLARALEADFVIAVDLNSNILGQYVRERGTGRRAKRRPNVIEVVTGSLAIVSVRITRSRLAGEPADAIIVPQVGHLGLLEYHRAVEAIAAGRAAAEAAIPQIKQMLDKA
jgi:NTE family protein